MICFTSSFIRQLYHFATDFDRVLLQLVGMDIENSLFKYRHLTFMIETFELLMKSCKNLTCYSDISKSVEPILAEFGVLMHNGPPYSKGYKKY